MSSNPKDQYCGFISQDSNDKYLLLIYYFAEDPGARNRVKRNIIKL